MSELGKAILMVIGVLFIAATFIAVVDCGTYNGVLQTWLRKRKKKIGE